MKQLIFGVIVAALLLITSWWIGLVEAGVGMVTGMVESFTSTGGSSGFIVVFCFPLLILMMLIVAVPYVLMPLAAASLLAWVGGRMLRRQDEQVTPSAGWGLVAATALCTIAFVALAALFDHAPRDVRYANHEPAVFPVACLSAANTAFAAHVAARILRKMTAN